MKYDHRSIEKKWQDHWLKNKTFKAEIDRSKPKYYILDMFPFPSGAGLHVGHVEGYTATDILARYKRQKGHSVLHPMGWDSFGLPAEQYAVRTGTHPRETTKSNVATFRRQLQSLGFSYDWDRELATTDESYVKWTQWIFTKLYEKGLAYEADMMVNYCPALGTVLANEEVENGCSKEGGHPVERRPLRQWVLKITAYAERLLEDLDLVDWPEGLKRLQRNWIGRSEGARVDFVEESTGEKIPIFTTCQDTLFGATFMVLAPEHSLVNRITTDEQRSDVEAYKKAAASKSDMERTELAKDKTGVATGAYAINPVNGQKIPIWISDYVLITYGTGAIMAVPAHDERDFEFAKKFGLKVAPVIDPELTAGSDLVPKGMTSDEVREKVLAGDLCWTGPGKACNSATDKLSIDGLGKVDAQNKVNVWLQENGLGEEAITYKLRDWLFSRQRYWGEPFPVLHFEDGSQRILELDELPLTLPEIDDYKPSGDGKSPLAKAKEWVEIVDPKTGKKALRETNTMPNWAGSCWYYLRFCDPKNDGAAWSEEAERYWLPVDMYIGGVEHAVLHLLYARFWHKVLYDCGHVSTLEPFMTLRNQGLIVSRSFQKEDGGYVYPEEVKEQDKKYYHRETNEELHSQVEKMSKSKLNGVTPDDVVEEFGADSLRLYEMFMGPLEKEKIWNTDAVSGCRRFLQRFYDMVNSDKVTDEVLPAATKLGHKLAYGVGKDIEGMLFNTAIAKMMEFINDFTKLPAYPREILAMAVQCLSPFAPHLAEEMWQLLGRETSLTYEPFPEADLSLLVEDSATYIVQVNGKLRGRFDLPKGQSEDELLILAKDDPAVNKHLDGKEIAKVIYVPNKLLNIVVR
ncbi:Leucine--tRNA ligase [Chlamydiales bacterium SCGC AG-110-P3]|nr:Leucine--tRNA ligase [Chlamydiales bacterium SCGC AG-110-P3]